MSASQPRETRVLELDCSNKDGQLFKLKTGTLYSECALPIKNISYFSMKFCVPDLWAILYLVARYTVLGSFTKVG